MKFLFLIVLLISVGCSKGTKRLDEIKISLPQEVSTVDPASCFDTVCYLPVAQVYESLYEIEYLKRPYSLRPLLADGFPVITDNRLKYTFKIKKGIRYHDSPVLPKGREVKAQDFAIELKRLAFMSTRSPAFWLVDGKIKGINAWRNKVGSDLELFFKEQVPGISTPDDHTLVIELVRPYPQLLWAMAMTLTAPVPEEAIRATKNDLAQTFVGTGAYSITSYNPSQEVALKKNENYVTSTYPTEGDRYANEKDLLKDAGAKLPFISNVRFVVIKESQTDWLNFMAKKIDIINLVKDQYPFAINQDGTVKPEITKEKINLQASPTLIYWWISYNMKDPVIGKNLNLRKAIAHGINIEKYIQLFTYNIGQKANSIFPPGIPGYSPSTDLPYKYDLELAKEFLKKAGYPNGKGLPTLVYDVRGIDTRKRQMGEFIQQELKNLGIQIEVRLNTFPAFLERSRKGELQFWQGGWVLDYPDAENVLQLLTTDNLPPGPNSSQYSNPEFDKMFNELREMDDGQEKFALMAKMEAIVNRDLPWSMQYYSRNYILYHDYLKNFRYSDIINNNIKYLKIHSK
jgi:oligopeptide transport system substrate-binding protein